MRTSCLEDGIASGKVRAFKLDSNERYYRSSSIVADDAADTSGRADAAQRLAGDWRVAGLADVVEVTTKVAPAIGEHERSAGSLGIGLPALPEAGHRVVPCIAVDLHRTGEA
jgi:hypothetical protein